MNRLAPWLAVLAAALQFFPLAARAQDYPSQAHLLYESFGTQIGAQFLPTRLLDGCAREAIFKENHARETTNSPINGRENRES